VYCCSGDSASQTCIISFVWNLEYYYIEKRNPQHINVLSTVEFFRIKVLFHEIRDHVVSIQDTHWGQPTNCVLMRHFVLIVNANVHTKEL